MKNIRDNLSSKQIIIIIILIIITIFSILFSVTQYKRNQDTLNKIGNIVVPNELKFTKQVKPNEVDFFQKEIEKEFDWFLAGNFSKNKDIGKPNYDLIKNIFNKSSGGISSEMGKNKRQEVLAEFSYSIEDFGITLQQNEYKALLTVNVTSTSHTQKKYLYINLDKNKKIKNGGFFDEIK